jgi:hypothetical protein
MLIGATRPASAEEPMARLTLDELPQLRAEVSLGRWRSLHPADRLELYSPKLAIEPNNRWCARMVSEVPLDRSRTAKRTAYFYLPPEPSLLALPPPNSQPQDLVSECRLGLVWTEAEDAGSAQAEAFGEAIRESVKSDLGPGEMDAKLHWLGSGAWLKTAHWENGRLGIASAVDFRPDENRKAVAIIAAAGEISAIRFRLVDTGDLTQEREAHISRHRMMWSRIEEALSIAGVGGQPEADFRKALNLVISKDAWWSQLATPSEQSAIFDAIDRWVSASNSLPPARQSAALFAADELLNESGGPSWGRDETPDIRQRLEGRGANFVWLELAGSYNYTRTWLRESLRLDPDGRAGEMAFFTLMEMGFETSGACEDQNGEGFRAVIKQGQEYLRRHPNSKIAPDIHFMMAQAYGDIVNLAAAGDGYDQTAIAKYQSEAASARTMAIEQFRAAFDSAADSPRAHEAWPDAWRLLAGLPPGQTHFYCVYD